MARHPQRRRRRKEWLGGTRREARSRTLARPLPGSRRPGAIETFSRRIDAEQWLTSVENSKLSGAYVDPAAGRVTFGAWARQWLDAPGKRPSAWARDESIMRVHLMPALEHRALRSLTPGDVQGLVTTWASRSAPRTVRRQYDTLRAILNAAVAAELVARSPCRRIRLPAVT